MVEERKTIVEEEETNPGLAVLLRRIVFLIFAVVAALIILRIILRLLNADQSNQYVRWILDASRLFTRPFDGILTAGTMNVGGYVLDATAVLALVAWSVIAFVVMALISVFRE